MESGDRAGLIGANGSGKSTLLRLIAGLDTPDGGQVTLQRDLSIAYLPQLPTFAPDATVGSAAFDGVPDDAEARIRAHLGQLGHFDLDAKVAPMSGGQQKKIALARALGLESELLLLDEPTNHLDIDSIVWLERELEKRRKALLLVTHDRYFLDRVVDRLIELDRGRALFFNGSWSAYLEERAARDEAHAKAEAKAESFLKRELEWLRRQPKARGTKQKARIDRYAAVRDREKLGDPAQFEFSVSGRRLGKKILEAKNISKRYGEHVIFENFNYFFKRAERIGLAGPNGVGKSTLLDILTRRTASDTGEVVVGVNTRFGYFDQQSRDLPGAARVLDYVKQTAGDSVTIGENEKKTATWMLDYFGFDGRMQYGQIERLSGGERRRLQLVTILMSDPNFLVFDEPTNDLDIDTLSRLESFLQNFGGCLVVVSHDRYFMDRVVDQLFVMEGDGKIETFPGNYSEYLEFRESKTAEDSARGADASGGGQNNANGAGETGAVKARKPGLSQKERREYEKLEREIAALEKEQGELEARLSAGTGSAQEIADWGLRRETIVSDLEARFMRWSELAERDQEASGGKRT